MNKIFTKLNIFTAFIFLTFGKTLSAKAQGLNYNYMSQYKAGNLPSILQALPNSLATIFFLLAALITIAFFVFWIWMLVHAIKSDIDYKPVWILVLWFLHFFGAIIYYFAVKREYLCYEDLEDICFCEDGHCVCGKANKEELEEVCICEDGKCVCGHVSKEELSDLTENIE